MQISTWKDAYTTEIEENSTGFKSIRLINFCWTFLFFFSWVRFGYLAVCMWTAYIFKRAQQFLSVVNCSHSVLLMPTENESRIFLYICCTTTTTTVVCEKVYKISPQTRAHTHTGTRKIERAAYSYIEAASVKMSIRPCATRQCERLHVTVQWTLCGDQLVLYLHHGRPSVVHS